MNEAGTPAPGVNAIDFYRNEIDRLRAQNAELRETVQFAIDSSMSYVDDEATLAYLRAILTKTAKEGE